MSTQHGINLTYQDTLKTRICKHRVSFIQSLICGQAVVNLSDRKLYHWHYIVLSNQ